MKANELKRQDTIQALKKLIGLNVGVSYYIPKMIHGHIVDLAFLYPNSTHSTKRSEPCATIMFDHKTGILLDYTNLSVQALMHNEQVAINSEINYVTQTSMDVDTYTKHMQNIQTTYEEICEFVFQESLTQEQQNVLKTYKESFDATVPESLNFYYHELNEEFFSWLSQKIEEV